MDMSEISHPTMGKMSKEEYENHMHFEKKHFNTNLYRENLTEKSTQVLAYYLNNFQKRIKKRTGKNIGEHVIEAVNKNTNSQKPVTILSVGSGPGGTEMNLAKKFSVPYKLDCIDINEKSLALGQEKAKANNLNLHFSQQDINNLKLDSETYDIVFAHAALHHMINHEHVADEIKKSMKPDGLFFVHEPIPRNGLRLWDDTKKITNEIWVQLPDKFKRDCTDKKNHKIINELPDQDLSKDGFECVRSQDLYPVLKDKFKIKIEVPGFSFARRFVDKRFGCNYDMNNPFDKATVDTIIRLDEEFTSEYHLKPESIFLVLEK